MRYNRTAETHSKNCDHKNRALMLVIVGIVILLAAGLVVMRNRQKQGSVASQGTFSVLQGDVDGHPMFATIDTGLRNSTERQYLPFFFSISTPLINPNNDGLPSGNDADNLNSWEDAVEARLRSAGRLAFVGRVTWNGHRELLYYLATQQPAIDDLKTLAESHSTRPFAFTSEHDEKWTKADFWLNRK
jgi:hypothetical protein